MLPIHLLQDLEVVGIADTLGRAVQPRLLPPVYRTKDGATVLYPPYSFVPGGIVPSMECPADDFAERVRLEQMTELPAQPARERWLLWVDDRQKVRYQSNYTVQTAFDKLFALHLSTARAAIEKLNPDLDTAYRHAAIAHAVVPDHLDPLVIRGAIQKYRGDELNLCDTRNFAARRIAPADFDTLISHKQRTFAAPN